jgi:hypothetical protein
MRDIMDAVRELRAGQLELRVSLAEHRLQANERLSAIAERQETLLDAIADLRAEYHGHTHPPE